jgi:N-acetylglucosamine kinase-like BadF-type ATPase
MLLLGVDGGGSKTAALLVDSTGQVLGTGMGGAANYHIFGIEHTLSSVKQAIEGALQGKTPDAVGFCMAAADMPHDFKQLSTAFNTLALPCPTVIHNDVIGIFRAGSRFSYGVGVVCGTGFNAGGISKNGHEFRLPALGSITGDCAGGGYLGERAMGAAFRAWDGRGKETLLTSAILKAFNVPNFETLAERYVQEQITEQHINNLAPLVFDASEQGDEVARQLIYEQGIELATAANAVLRRLDLLDDDCDVVIGGSMAHGKGSLLMNTVNAVVHDSAPNAVVKRLDVPPVVGAVLLAADHIGATMDSNFATTLRSTLPLLGFSTEQASV